MMRYLLMDMIYLDVIGMVVEVLLHMSTSVITRILFEKKRLLGPVKRVKKLGGKIFE